MEVPTDTMVVSNHQHLRNDIFLPFQQRWMQDRSLIRLGEKSRQIGWTWMNAAEDALNGLSSDNKANTYFQAGDSEAAKAYIDDVRFWCEELGKTIDPYTDTWHDYETGLDYTVYTIRFPNGTKVEGMSSNPRRLRGRRGNVKLDEFAFHDNPQELLKAATPVTTWGYQLSIWSTHNGIKSIFNNLCQMAQRIAEGKKRRSDMNISFHRVTLLDAVADGLAKRVNQITSQDMTDVEFIDHCRGKCLTEDDYQQEYMYNPSSEVSSWITYNLFDSCVIADGKCGTRTDDLGVYLLEVAEHTRDATAVYAGVDFGRTHDRFVHWTIAQYGDVYKTAGILSWQDRKWAENKQSISKLMELQRQPHRVKMITYMCLDATGMGSEPAEWAEETYPYRAEGITFTQPSKHDMAVKVKNVFDDKQIQVPFDELIRDDFHSITKTISANGKPRFAGERTADGHADHFWALGLALKAADASPSQARAVTITEGDY